MKTAIFPILVMTSAMAFSDDCVFDLEQQFDDKKAFLQSHNNAVLSHDDQTFIIENKHGQLTYGFGGCQRYGVLLSLTTEQIIRSDDVTGLVLELVKEFDRLDIDLRTLESKLDSIEWGMTSQHYTVALDGLSHFSVSFDDDVMKVVYYVG